MTITYRFFILWLISAVLLLSTSQAYAQDSIEPNLAAPLLKVLRLNTQDPAAVEVGFVGVNFPETIDNYQAEVINGGSAQTVSADSIERLGGQVAVLIDGQDLSTPDGSGETRKDVVDRLIWPLIDQGALRRHVDQVAAFEIGATGELLPIEPWTDEPNLFFNSIVLTPLRNTNTINPIAPALLAALENMEATGETGLVRSLFVFTAHVNESGFEDVIAKANALNAYIHIVDVSNEIPNGAAPAIATLAQATQGLYINSAGGPVTELMINHLEQSRVLRQLTFQPSGNATDASVRLTLSDGSFVETSALAAAANVAGGGNEQAAVAEQPVQASNDASNGQEAVVQAPTALSLDLAESADLSNSGESDDLVQIPFTSITLPRNIMIIVVGVLVLVLLYLVYKEFADKRSKNAETSGLEGFEAQYPAPREAAAFANQPASAGAYGAPGNQPPSAFRNDDADIRARQPHQQEEVDPYAADLAATVAQSERRHSHQNNRQSAGRNIADSIRSDGRRADGRRPESAGGAHREPPQSKNDKRDFEDDVIGDDDVTVVLPPNMDDMNTVRLPESKEAPVMGHFVRLSNEADLPDKLTIYGSISAESSTQQTFIGRHSQHNTLLIKHRNVSREHAILLQRDNQIFLRDNDSTTGTYLNGRKLVPHEEMLLRDNDEVVFGTVAYMFKTANLLDKVGRINL